MFRKLLARWKYRAERRREIFRYYDGTRIRRADPIEIYYALKADPEYDLETHPEQVDQGDDEAVRVSCRAVQRAFGVSPWDDNTGTGLTLLEQLAVLADFFVFLYVQKKTTERMLNSLGNSDATSNGSGKPTTSDTSDTGPTVTELPSDSPTVCGSL